jgi:hypothetical protein|tara:strand:+ start:4420 stop:5157 length:738 start_codon:yes stop_codon:yes gene_type:complete
MQVISENFAVARSVKVKYPKINKPYKFDDKENRTLPCGAKEQGAEYLMEFEVTKDQAKALNKMAKALYEDRRKPKWPEDCPIPFKILEDEEGNETYVVKAKKKAAYDGELTDPPQVFDAKNVDVTSPDFPLSTGSTANVAFTLVPYSMSTNHGVSLRLHSVQVTKLLAIAAKSPFSIVEGYSAPEGFVGETALEDDEPVKEKPAPVLTVVEDADEDDEPIVAKKKGGKKGKPSGDMASVIDEWDD